MSSFLFNDSRNQILTDKIVEMIDDACSYIKTGNFLFQDPVVIDALCNALDRGIAVFIISNIPEHDARMASQEGGGHVNTHEANLKKLRRKGAHCRGLDDLHAKFILRDGKEGLLMSANFSPNSVRRNIETGVILGEDERNDLEYTFNKLFLNSDVQGLSGTSEITQISRTRSVVDDDTFEGVGLDSDLRLTIASNVKKGHSATNLRNCVVTTIYQSILHIIEDAEKTLDIVTWHFKALDRLPEFKLAVKNAIRRGVAVRLYSNSKEQHPNLQKSLECISELERIGCKSFGDDNNHSKCVMSESEGIIFTANIDGNHGLTNGFEVGCVLEDETLDEMREFVESLFE